MYKIITAVKRLPFRTMLRVSVVTTFISVVIYVGVSAVITRGYGEVEAESVRQTALRLGNALEIEHQRLADVVGDWAPWNDTHDFVLEPEANAEFVTDNLVPGTLTNFNLDFMAFFDLDGDLVQGFGLPLEGFENGVPTSLLNHLEERDELLRFTEPDAADSGLLELDEVYLIGSAPIVRSNYEGVIAGTMMVGRRLDQQVLRQMEAQTIHGVQVVPRADLPETGGATVGKEAVQVIPLNHSEVAAHLPLEDVYGESGLFLRAALPRDIFAQTEETKRMILILLAAVGALGGTAAGLRNARMAKVRAALAEANAMLEVRVQERTSQLKDANAQLQHDAFHDSLTGLPNRALFVDRLELCMRRRRRNADKRYAVLFIDADRFKLVNDTLGHAAGDELLEVLATRLTAAVREVDTVARVGGDEFVVLLEDVEGASDAREAAERIQKAAQEPMVIQGQTVYVTLSIGVAVGDSEYGSADELIRDADIAMYLAKSMGRSNTQAFTLDLREQAKATMEVKTELKAALDRCELSVEYQPIVELSSGKTTGVEALVRWHSPRLGTVAPVEFIPAAEESGLVIEVDRYVLRRACEEMMEWRREDTALELSLSVNFSAQQFSRQDLVPAIRAILASTGFPADRLELEITETTLLRSNPECAASMAELSSMGVKLNIDDFGNGHSNFSYLRAHPVRTLKIDRSFIQSIETGKDSLQLVETILSMARSMGIAVTAEGIETDGQRKILSRLGCEFGQGYFFARPQKMKDLKTKHADGVAA